MTIRFRGTAIALAALAASYGVTAFAAGNYETYPIVGSSSFCASIVTGTGGFTIPQGNTGGGGATGQGQGIGPAFICAQTIPAGPAATTGTELIPADLNTGNGTTPVQSVTIPSSLIGGYNNRINRLIGGDFATNLWQRGTTFSALTPTTATMTADRWAAFSTGNTVTISKQTGAADTVPAVGLYGSMRVSRPSGTNTTAICVGQTMDKEATAELISKNGVLSFYALAGAGLAAVDPNNNITVNVAYYTAADSATPGTNTGTFMAGTITGYTPVVAGLSQITAQNGTAASVANGAALIPISTTWTRYAVYAPIPVATAAGTAVTGAGVTICYTPTSGTGGATEWFEIAGVQLQAQAGPTVQMPSGVTAPSGFEMRSPALETAIEQYYSYVLTDGAVSTVYPGFCSEITANTTGKCTLFFASPMRIVPTTTVGTATSFSMRTAADAANVCTTLAGVASSNTTASAGLSCTAAGTVPAGVASPFVGANTGGLLTFSAEP